MLCRRVAKLNVLTSASLLRNEADAWPTSMYLIRTLTSKCGKFRFPYLPAVVFRDFIAKIRIFRPSFA